MSWSAEWASQGGGKSGTGFVTLDREELQDAIQRANDNYNCLEVGSNLLSKGSSFN